jgi:hypothetical protein
MASKRVKELVDKMRLPAVICLSTRQLILMTARCNITEVELPRCEIEGKYADWIAGGLLAQCRALVHLDLSGNANGYHGAGSFAGVLTHWLTRQLPIASESGLTEEKVLSRESCRSASAMPSAGSLQSLPQCDQR